MHYNEKKGTIGASGVWDEKTCIRRQGGYDIDKSNLPEGMKYLPKGAVVAFNAMTGCVILIKSAKLYDEAASGATTIHVAKGHALKENDTIGGVTISKIESGEVYDTLTVSATSKKLTAGTVLVDGNATKALGLNYAPVKLDDAPTCTVTVQAYEIEEDTLPYPINDEIKTALTCRHAFKL